MIFRYQWKSLSYSGGLQALQVSASGGRDNWDLSSHPHHSSQNRYDLETLCPKGNVVNEMMALHCPRSLFSHRTLLSTSGVPVPGGTGILPALKSHNLNKGICQDTWTGPTGGHSTGWPLSCSKGFKGWASGLPSLSGRGWWRHMLNHRKLRKFWFKERFSRSFWKGRNPLTVQTLFSFST